MVNVGQITALCKETDYHIEISNLPKKKYLVMNGCVNILEHPQESVWSEIQTSMFAFHGCVQ